MRKLLLVLLFIPLFVFSLSYEEIKKAYQQSFFYEKIGDYKDAIRALMPVYKAYPNTYTVNLRLGWLYYLWGKYNNSIYHYDKANQAAPASVEAKLGLSLPLMAQHKWGDAEKVLYKVLAIDFYNYYGNLRLCKVLEKEKKYRDQLMVALKMLNLYPASVPFLVEKGKAFYHLGNLEASLKVFRDVLILDPENLTAKDYLKKVEQRLGKKKRENKKTQKVYKESNQP